MTLEATDDLLRRVLAAPEPERAAALDRLMARLHPKVVVWASTRMSASLKARMEPEDVAQEIAVRLARSLPEFRSGGAEDVRRPFYGWLWTVAENCVRDLVDHAQADKRKATPLWGTFSQTTPSQAANRRESVEAMLRALDLLEPDDRDVIRLVKLQGQSAQEVATLQGKSPNAVRVHLCRALKALAERLRDVGSSAAGPRTAGQETALPGTRSEEAR
jgi:RNA polymerase sigma-70 factor (ECF subfamily)